MTESEIPSASSPGSFWDDKYSPSDYRYGLRPNAFLVDQAWRLSPGSRVLAVGDGEGRNGVWLSQQGHRVVSVDVSPRGLQKAAALALKQGVRLTTICADLRSWDWPVAEYDAVVSIFVHFLTADRPALHRGMVGALRPGGLLVLEAFAKGQLAWDSGGPREPEMLYSAQDLEDDFAGTEILLKRERLTKIAEGPGHEGPAVTVDMVVRRPK